MTKLIEYFHSPLYKDALASYQRVARNRRWYIRNKFMMYNWAKLAFDDGVSPEEKMQAFTEIYHQLRSYWQVFRNAKGRYWTSQEIFDALTSKCKACAREGELSLLTIQLRSPGSQEILTALRELTDLKPSADYPYMPVAKFTHFFNPKLFPIYDNEIIWKSVLNGVFKADYRDWCKRNYLNPIGPGVKFNLHYILWAGHHIRQADDSMMAYFSEWFTEQTKGEDDEHNVLGDMHQYFSTAFEFIAIGAAELLNS